jgi:hypothetical protein
MKSLRAKNNGSLRSYDRFRFVSELSGRCHRRHRCALGNSIDNNVSRFAAAPGLVTGYQAQTIWAVVFVMLAFIPLVLLLVKLWH